MDIQHGRTAKTPGNRHAQRRYASSEVFVALIDVTHEAWESVRLERLGKDLKNAFRQLRRSPVFTIT
jgi:hypothetical protein